MLVIVGGVAFWFLKGQNKGWTKTSKEIDRVDEVTGITSREYQPGFYPGVDFLGTTTIGGIVIFGISFLFRRKPVPNNKS